MSQECEICLANPFDDGACLHRVNPVGELPAIWRCSKCLSKDQKADVTQAEWDIIDAVKKLGKEKP